MKKGLKRKLITLFAAVACLFTVAGCKLNDTKEDILDKYNLTVSVTYYANGYGASFGTSSASANEEIEGTDSSSSETETPKAPVKTKTLWYSSGSVPLNIGVVKPDKGTAKIEWNGYEFKGWYYVVRDEAGEIVYEADGTMKLGEKVDFSKPLQAGETLEFCADWRRLPVVNLFIGELDGQQIKEEKLLKTFSFIEKPQVDTPTDMIYEIGEETYTVINFYSSPECNELLDWPIMEPTEKDAEDIKIYAKCIKGSWTLLEDKDDVKNFFTNATTANSFYLCNDIDCKGLIITPPRIFGATLRGNGNTIKNFKVETKVESDIALFGRLTANAKIENVIFENIEIKYEVGKQDVYIYLVFRDMLAENGKIATITGVEFKDITLDITKSSNITIFNISNANETTNWLYGGKPTDADYKDIVDIEYLTTPTLTITEK